VLTFHYAAYSLAPVEMLVSSNLLSLSFLQEFIAQQELWRFFTRALPHDNRFSTTTLISHEPSLKEVDCQGTLVPYIGGRTFLRTNFDIRSLLIQKLVPKLTT